MGSGRLTGRGCPGQLADCLQSLLTDVPAGECVCRGVGSLDVPLHRLCQLLLSSQQAEPEYLLHMQVYSLSRLHI